MKLLSDLKAEIQGRMSEKRMRKEADKAALENEMTRAEGAARRVWAEETAARKAAQRYAGQMGVAGESEVSSVGRRMLEVFGSGGGGYNTGGLGGGGGGYNIDALMGGGRPRGGRQAGGGLMDYENRAASILSDAPRRSAPRKRKRSSSKVIIVR